MRCVDHQLNGKANSLTDDNNPAAAVTQESHIVASLYLRVNIESNRSQRVSLVLVLAVSGITIAAMEPECST
jgi:hypothetical protein